MADTALTDAELSTILAVATRAARLAGARIREFSLAPPPVLATKADFADLVTEVDKQCQDLILGAVREAFGASHEFLGEEDVPPGAAAAAAAIAAVLARRRPVWVVDPIDGTTNFAAGLPLSCVSIGVADGSGRVVVGVILDPHRDELFTAVRGRGAHLNGAPMRVAPAAALRESLWGWGLHHARHVSKTMLRAAGVFADEVRGMRALGSAALMMAYVACGRLGGFFEHELCAWGASAARRGVVFFLLAPPRCFPPLPTHTQHTHAHARRACRPRGGLPARGGGGRPGHLHARRGLRPGAAGRAGHQRCARPAPGRAGAAGEGGRRERGRAREVAAAAPLSGGKIEGGASFF